MTKRIEEELAEMNRLKRLELEFLFFKSGLDETIYQKFRNALTNENAMTSGIQFEDVEPISKLDPQDGKIQNVSRIEIPIKKVEA